MTQPRVYSFYEPPTPADVAGFEAWLAKVNAEGWTESSATTTPLTTVTMRRPLPALPFPLAPGELGLDVSHWQGSIDFARVKAAGYRFVYVKLTQGVNITDSRGRENFERARAAGLHVGAYHFFEWDRDGGQQATFFSGALGEDVGQLTPAIDVEPDGQRVGIDKVVSTENLRKLLTTIESMGLRPPVIYTSQGAWPEMTTQPAWGPEYPLWSADWTPPLNLPAGWAHARFWQRGKRPVDGVAGEVDWNVFQGWTPVVPPPPAPGTKHTLTHLTNNQVFSLFKTAFGDPYYAVVQRALDEAQMLANRTAKYSQAAIEDMPLMEGEKMALVAAL